MRWITVSSRLVAPFGGRGWRRIRTFLSAQLLLKLFAPIGDWEFVFRTAQIQFERIEAGSHRLAQRGRCTIAGRGGVGVGGADLG